MNNAPWNRCDVCGKFIAYKDFDSGEAVRFIKYGFEGEEIEHTYCKQHKDED